jgi:hypothetical protein
MYEYQKVKPILFTDEGQRKFLAVRDRVQTLVAQSGAIRMDEAISKTSGDTWEALACVDRMVELGELREIGQRNEVSGQHRIFVGVR